MRIDFSRARPNARRKSYLLLQPEVESEFHSKSNSTVDINSNFACAFQMEPNIVAKYCAKNEYLLVAPFEIVDRKVQILLDYNVKPISILRSLYALDRSEQVYVSRLQRLISLNTEDVKVWFFKCADDVFEKYLSKMHQTKLKRTKEKIEPQSMTKIQIENKLNEMLECDGSEAAHIYYNQISRFDQIDSAKQNIEFLRSNGVSLETITGNSAVLTMPIGLFYSNMCI